MDQPNKDFTYHRPVMVEEVTEFLAPAAAGWIVDGTYGGGGHSRAILDRFADVRVVGIDRDPDAVGQAIDDPRLTIVQANFSELGDVLGRQGLPPKVDAILLDLGVSSHQLDESSRGFSYHQDGPLDMRMGQGDGRTAADVVNESTVEELTMIFRTFGEERFAHRIASAIVDQRPFTSTDAFARCVAESVPAPARRKRHPARKVFQALRIAVNSELTHLEETLDGGFDHLEPGGRFAVMSYHSLEDRMVKQSFNSRAAGCTCPPDLPICACGANPDARLVTRKAIKPTDREIAMNPRARSAVLRVAEKVAP